MRRITMCVDSDPTSLASELCAAVEQRLGVLLHVERDHGDTVQGHLTTHSDSRVEVVLYELADAEQLQAKLDARGIQHTVDVDTKNCSRSEDALRVELAGVLAQMGFIPVI